MQTPKTPRSDCMDLPHMEGWVYKHGARVLRVEQALLLVTGQEL
ncbi:MAG: hypothetical protein ACRD1B_01900 [Thermoanaerobaculia bacterium]